jgi:glycine/D-amino acid oxidase-like deaminating enzyme
MAERIAILGGGIAGLTAAFELSEINRQRNDRHRSTAGARSSMERLQ